LALHYGVAPFDLTFDWCPEKATAGSLTRVMAYYLKKAEADYYFAEEDFKV